MMVWYLLLLVVTVQGWGDLPLVKLDQGWIRGTRATDGNYSMFMGIPFAAVDKQNPFGPAKPNPKVSGIFFANEDSVHCPQVTEGRLSGTIDCLNVNVFVPDRAQTEALPVLVWFHGGRFRWGSGGIRQYGPKFIVRHDVILVTLNYRLGPFGFLCPGTDRVPGNQGLKDQILALRWVRDNIEVFGGDVHTINVFGTSAGAMSIESILLSTQEKLFTRAILQSGSVARPGIVLQPNPDIPLILAERLGYVTTNIDDAVDYISKQDVDQIITASIPISTLFRPCYEDNFLPYPLNYDTEKIKSTQILSGYNSHESLMTYVHATTEEIQAMDIFNETVKMFNVYDEEVATIMRRFYIGDEDITQVVKMEIADFESDYSFAYPVHRSVNKFAEVGADVYHYLFSYSGGRNFIKSRRNVTEGGAVHADEMGYLFDMSVFDSDPVGNDRITLDRMTTLWTNFVKSGDPTPDITELLPVKWIPATNNTLHVLNIDTDLKIVVRPDNDRYALWDLFFDLYD